jgi:hypothetical protein
MSDEDDFSDDGMMIGRPGGGSIVRREFFEKVISPKVPLTVNVPEQDNWRLVVSQVSKTNPAHLQQALSLPSALAQACLGENGAPDGCRVVLKAGVDKAETVVGHFRGGQVEHIALGGWVNILAFSVCSRQFPYLPFITVHCALGWNLHQETRRYSVFL